MGNETHRVITFFQLWNSIQIKLILYKVYIDKKKNIELILKSGLILFLK